MTAKTTWTRRAIAGLVLTLGLGMGQARVAPSASAGEDPPTTKNCGWQTSGVVCDQDPVENCGWQTSGAFCVDTSADARKK